MLAVAVLRAGARPRVSVAAIPRARVAALLGALMLVPAHLPSVLRPVLALSVFGVGLLVFGAMPRELLEQIPRPRRWQHS